MKTWTAAELLAPTRFERVPDVEAWLSGAEVTAVYTDGQETVLVGIPDKYSRHDCDEMACGPEHVLVRIRAVRAEEAG